jgi:predicted transcriptional regulator
MKRCDGNRTKASALLGITPQAMSQYLRKRE